MERWRHVLFAECESWWVLRLVQKTQEQTSTGQPGAHTRDSADLRTRSRRIRQPDDPSGPARRRVEGQPQAYRAIDAHNRSSFDDTQTMEANNQAVQGPGCGAKSAETELSHDGSEPRMALGYYVYQE